MTWGMVAVGGATLVGGMISSNAAGNAADTQAGATQAGIAQQDRRFAEVQKLLSPYSNAGTSSLSKQQALLGLDTPSSVDWAAYVNGNPDALANWSSVVGTSSDSFGGDIAKFGQYHYQKDGSRRDLSPFTTGGINGKDAQQAAINDIANSSQFIELAKQGEQGMLQNASATGGLRGGNTQAALAQFRPAMLQQLINDQYAKLGGLTSIGQNAAAGVGNAGMQTGQQVSQLLQQQGAAQAGGQIAQGKVWSDAIGSLGGLAASKF